MNELFDVKKYREQYEDLDAAFGEDWDAYLNHYLTIGVKEGRDTGTETELQLFLIKVSCQLTEQYVC